MAKKKKKYSDAELDKYFSDKEYRKKEFKKRNGLKISTKLFLLSLIFLVIGITAFMVYLVQGLPSLAELENPKLEEATKVYSVDGELIDKFFLQNRTKVTLDNIPKEMINALIATEDRKFFDHWGLDVDRIIKAIFKNIASGNLKREGASTITQQLAGNLYTGREVTWNRKLREAITAVQIERTYTKDEILAYYLNAV